MKQSIKKLEEHQAWRRGDDSEQGSPALIGLAIDDCVQAAKRYELVRTLNPREFKQLWMRNMLHGEGFDDMVDELVKARAK